MSDACEHFREQLGGYLYGELAETAPLDRHLEQCAECRRELKATKRALAVVDRAGLDSAPKEIVDAVVSGVAAGLHSRPRRAASRRWLRVAVSVAACLLLVAAGTWIFVPSGDRESPTLSNRELELEAEAVAVEAQSVLRLLDELEKENDTLIRLLGRDGVDVPGIQPDEGTTEKEPA